MNNPDGTLRALTGSQRSTNYDDWERWMYGPTAPRYKPKWSCIRCNIVYLCVVFILVVIGLRSFPWPFVN